MTELATLATDPMKFMAVCWPDMQLYAKQRDVLVSVRDNLQTVVHAANQTGKSRIAAVTAIWFFASRQPSRVITTSSSETQLMSILWSEIKHLIDTSQYRLPFRVTTLKIEKLKDPRGQETEPQDYLLGHVAREVENFQGHHLPADKPRVLFIGDESSGIPDQFFDAASSWAHRMLLIGNPLNTTNFFYRLCKAGDVPDPAGAPGLLRKIVHIGGSHSPNVQLAMKMKASGSPGPYPTLIPGLLSFADFLRRDQEWDEVKRTTRLRGQFYLGDQAMLFPSHWLDAAMDAELWRRLQRQQRTVEGMGVDIAGGGRDNSCWTLIDRHGVIEQIVVDTPNTMDVVGRTIALMREHGLSNSQVAVDAGGMGKPICDRLWEQGHKVKTVNFGETAGKKDGDVVSATKEPDPRKSYTNRRGQLYGNLRERLDPRSHANANGNGEGNGTFAFPPDAADLRHELSILPLQYDSEGRMFLPPKDPTRAKATGQVSIQSLLGRSPDRADSLVLALHALRVGRPQVRASWGGVINVTPRAWSSLGMPGWGGRW
ncbi:MAG: hypothetical protein CMJ50_00165 [Planctomycetaceae bacterium]|nr:hypothetical protein [Planctomycetaceae bacterium]